MTLWGSKGYLKQNKSLKASKNRKFMLFRITLGCDIKKTQILLIIYYKNWIPTVTATKKVPCN